MKWIQFLFLLTLIMSIYFYYRRDSEYELSTYEAKLINYFMTIALNIEYGSNPKRIIKWDQPMIIEVVGANEVQSGFVRSAINSINSLSLAGFNIQLVDKGSTGNVKLYFTSLEQLRLINPAFYKKIESLDFQVEGCGNVYFNTNYLIYRGFIFIDPSNALIVQESTVLEEIVHCIGLLSDSNDYPYSILYENKSEDNLNPTKLSRIDKDIIRLLYHPKILAGMSRKSVTKKIIELFRNGEFDFSTE